MRLLIKKITSAFLAVFLAASVGACSESEHSQGTQDPQKATFTNFSWKDAVDTVKVSDKGAYPRLYQLNDGRLMCARDNGKTILISYSSDGGESWEESKAQTTFHSEFACANPAIIQLDSGEILLAYRALGYINGKHYGAIHVSSSLDGGKSWQKHSDVIVTCNESEPNSAVYEPHFIMMEDTLTVFYANADEGYVQTPYQHVEYKQYVDGKWTNRTVVSNGNDHRSRDGMPYVIRLSSGEYVCAIEGWILGTRQLMIKLVYSKDGKEWSEPIDVYAADGVNAGAPAVAELPDGRIVVSFQTAEDCPDKDLSTCAVMKSVVSDGTSIDRISKKNFSSPEKVFGIPEGYFAKWNSLYVTSEWLYAAAGMNYPERQIVIKRYSFDKIIMEKTQNA